MPSIPSRLLFQNQNNFDTFRSSEYRAQVHKCNSHSTRRLYFYFIYSSNVNKVRPTFKIFRTVCNKFCYSNRRIPAYKAPSCGVIERIWMHIVRYFDCFNWICFVNTSFCKHMTTVSLGLQKPMIKHEFARFCTE